MVAGTVSALAASRTGDATHKKVTPASSVETAAPNATAPGPFTTLLFSRTQMTAADNCVPDNTGIAQLATAVAPFLHSLGMPGTGTLVTGLTKQNTRYCSHLLVGHYGETLAASWADAAHLADTYGWSFVSHTATYPPSWSNLTPAQIRAETCGSATTIARHGLPGAHGLIAYPGNVGAPTRVQADYSAKCFAWGRRYFSTGITPQQAGATPPYWQDTEAVNGGACNVPAAPCYQVQSTAGHRYTIPDQVIAGIAALKPGQWFTLQAFILVEGTNSRYTQNKDRWDCTSPNPKLHWSNDNERYCYSDWKKIVGAIAARPDITVTDPLTVGVAFGRPATYLGLTRPQLLAAALNGTT
jgi:hypothetical protein